MPRQPARATVAPAATATPKARPPRRGRPPQDEATQQAVRRRLLDATRRAFTRAGYHALSVELILAEAGLSRPTFYKHFRNSDEPIRLVIREVNDDLIQRLSVAVASALAQPARAGTGTGHRDVYALIDGLVGVWRQWGTDLGPMLRPLFNELHDAHSPAAPERLRTHAILGDQLLALTTALGRQPASRLAIDALLQGVEYLGYRWQLDTSRDAASWRETRDAMLRLTLALLGGPEDWTQFPAIAARLGLQAGAGDDDGAGRPVVATRTPRTNATRTNADRRKTR
ncbi:MAG: TetR/AcrR family transcriptional regulator [Gammaproteobacteria bacterium]